MIYLVGSLNSERNNTRERDTPVVARSSRLVVRASPYSQPLVIYWPASQPARQQPPSPKQVPGKQKKKKSNSFFLPLSTCNTQRTSKKEIKRKYLLVFCLCVCVLTHNGSSKHGNIRHFLSFVSGRKKVLTNKSPSSTHTREYLPTFIYFFFYKTVFIIFSKYFRLWLEGVL